MKITQRDREKAARLIRRLTPTALTYKKYRKAAEDFIRQFNGASRSSRNPIFRLEMIESKLFGKSYLAGFVSREWFDQMMPHCDAIATASLVHLAHVAPPLVILPGKSISRKRGIYSIIEHEIVHVNQGILGEFPSLGSCKPSAGRLFRELTRYTLAEYEANFIQIAHDLSFAPPEEYNLGIEEWCHLRGFTGGLETALHHHFKEGSQKEKLAGFVKKIETDLGTAFKRLGLSESIGRAFAGDMDRMVTLAMFNLQRGTRGI